MFQSKFKYFFLLSVFFVMLGCSQNQGGPIFPASEVEGATSSNEK